MNRHLHAGFGILLGCAFAVLPATAQVLVEDDFCGTTLDTSEWTATARAGAVVVEKGLRLQANSAGEQVRWNQLYVTGITQVPRTGRTVITYDVEWNNMWFLIGLTPAGQPFSAWESDLRLGFHVHGPQLWALTNAKDFGRGVHLDGGRVSGDGPGQMRLRITLGTERGAIFQYDAGRGWITIRDTRSSAGADDSASYHIVFLLSRSDTNRPDCWLNMKHVSAEVGGEPPPAAQQEVAEEAIPGKIVYVREEIPTVTIPPYQGVRYVDTVPDTYDVSERARLAINGLTGPTNPLADYELYWIVFFGRSPVVMAHDLSDWCQLKFMEALPLLRMMTGDMVQEEVDRVWTDVTLKSIGPDGLFYIPLEGRPWGRLAAMWGDHGVARADASLTSFRDPTVTQFSHPYSCGRSMCVMMVYHLRDHNVLWTEACRRMIDRLLELAIHQDDYCYFPAFYFEPNAKYDHDSPYAAPPKAILGGEVNGRVIKAAARFYEMTGYEPARELAAKQTRYMRFHNDYFGPAGEFIAERHFHAHTVYLLGMLEYARAAHDEELLEFIRESYTWAKTPEAGSSNLLGFFPEIADPSYRSCESCEIADMIALALELSEAKVGDFYGDAERWTRNHFAESQLTRCDWLYRQAAQRTGSESLQFNETAHRTPERNLGAFAGWSAANDWWTQGPGIMHCCTGNAARTLYYIWDHILDLHDDQLSIHMLLNRASPWADVYSHIPYNGQVDIKIKQASKNLRVHAPDWIETGSGELVATVESAPRPMRWQDRYVELGPVNPGETVCLRFPIQERTVKETIGTVPYTIVVKGDTVVAIDPPGKNHLLYQRDHYRQGQTRWRKVARFVTEEELHY